MCRIILGEKKQRFIKVYFASHNNILESVFRDFEEDDPDWVSELKMVLKHIDWKLVFTYNKWS